MKKITLLFVSLFVVLSLSANTLFDKLYLVGDGCEAGWDPGRAIELTKTGDGIFKWSGTLNENTGGRRFKFIVARDWHPSITCQLTEPGHLVLEPGQEYDLFVRPDGDTGHDNAFQVTATGIYTINVNLNTMKLTIAAGSEEETPELTQLFLTGSATNAEGTWDNQNPISMTELSEGVFIWNGYLFTGSNDEPGEFMFLNEIGSWNKAINARANDINTAAGSSYSLKFRPLETDPEDYKFIVNNAGNYTIQVDLNTLKIKFMQIDYDNLYIVGNALTGISGVWEIEDALAMDRIESGIFSWTGPLHALDETTAKTEFKFISQKEPENWSNDFVFDERLSGNITIENEREYVISYRISGNDNKFEIPEPGTYNINVDLNTMKMFIEKESGSSVRNIYNDEAPFHIQSNISEIIITMKNQFIANSIDIFDITGKKIIMTERNLSSLTISNKFYSGIYIVRVNCNDNIYSSKIIIK